MTGDRRPARTQPAAYGAFRASTAPGERPAGSTCLAIDPSTHATVAVYVLDVRSKGRRKDSAIATALHAWCADTVAHPAIPRPLGAGVEAGAPYVVYPLLHGTTVEDLLQREGARPLDEVIRCLTPVASAIDCAAADGICHGALSPAHIVVDDDAVYVTAIGLTQALTQAGLAVPFDSPWASPERRRGEPPSLAGDIYALTATALAMLAGETPALQEDQSGHDDDRAANAALPLTALEEEVLRKVVGVDARILREAMARGLSEDPRERPASASELVQDLRSALVHERGSPYALANDNERSRSPLPLTATSTAEGGAGAEGWTGGRRNLALAVVLLAGLGAVLAGGLLLGGRSDGDAPAPPAADGPAAPVAPIIEPSPATPSTSSETPDSQGSEPETRESTRPTTPPPPERSPSDAERATSPPARAPRQRDPGAPAAVDPDAPGSLLARSTPTGARVFVDGALVGTTPLLLPGLSPGAHQIRMELEGFPEWSSTVDIEPTRRSRLEVKLDQQ